VEPLAMDEFSPANRASRREAMSDETYRITLTEAERERWRIFNAEVLEKVIEVRQIFSNDTRGMMMFMSAMYIMAREWPAFTKADIPQRVMEWIAVGEPDDITDIPAAVLMRSKRENN
jgi:hypothetical protein